MNSNNYFRSCFALQNKKSAKVFKPGGYHDDITCEVDGRSNM